jgi:hypothetical protein
MESDVGRPGAAKGAVVAKWPDTAIPGEFAGYILLVGFVDPDVEDGMLCWNCGRKVPDTAKVCKHCEADLSDAPGEEEMAAVEGILKDMDPDMLAEMLELAQNCSSAEEFADRIMVGDCPACGSAKTGNCENDPEMEDITLGRCFECGQIWCTLCDRVLEKGETTCDCEFDFEEEEE